MTIIRSQPFCVSICVLLHARWSRFSATVSGMTISLSSAGISGPSTAELADITNAFMDAVDRVEAVRHPEPQAVHGDSHLVVTEDSSFVTLPFDISGQDWDAMLADIDRLGYVMGDDLEYGEDHNDGYGDRFALLRASRN